MSRTSLNVHFVKEKKERDIAKTQFSTIYNTILFSFFSEFLRITMKSFGRIFNIISYNNKKMTMYFHFSKF